MHFVYIVIAVYLKNYLLSAEEYQGLFLGKFNTYAHQVSGDVYAIDEYTFLLKNFFYDGLGQDAYFWCGATVRPSNIGFIVPDENGKTNKLRQYINRDITIKIPDDKKITSLKWLAVWDIRDNKNFADIYIPEGFQPPAPQTISEFSRFSHDVKSGPVIIVNSKTIQIPNLFYDGEGKNTYFFAGTGPQPNPSGKKIPDEKGYLNVLGPYSDETITLELPGDMKIFDVDWISIWDEELNENFGSVIIPDGLNVPPSLTKVIKHESRMPNCEQLHKRLQLHWEIFGPQITFQIVGQVDPTDYIALGISGSSNSSKMDDADVAISYLEGHFGFTHDYNITGKFPCTNIMGLYRGVCPDTKVGGVENFQIHLFSREDGLTKITYRRNLLNTGDDGDQIYNKNGLTYLVWAVGKNNAQKEPRFHYLYPKGNIAVDFGRKNKENNCFDFTENQNKFDSLPDMKPWGPIKLFNRSLTTFYARIGDSGGFKGYYGLTGGVSSPGLVWYINGLLAPILYVKRGRTYTFRVEGGNNPYNSYYYHPLYITNDPHGGFIEYSESERKKLQVYAGIEFDKKGRPTPTSSGRLCTWSIPSSFDKRKADSFQSFIQFRSILNYSCEDGNAAILQWTPNVSTPDVVYYQSYTQRNMGYKIIVLDDFINSSSFKSKISHFLLISSVLFKFVISKVCFLVFH